jgi:hypothetical protein
MANVSLQLQVSGTLDAGATASHRWKNAPSKRVWAFSVEPADVTDGLLTESIAFEITRVLYWLESPGKRHVEVEVKNVGGITWGYNIYMAQISD